MELSGIFDLNIALRLLMSFFCGFALGFEREITGKFAGLRTHILVAAGASIFTILSIYGFNYFVNGATIGTNDPARIAAQIITGIGFIGAGTVMKQGMTVSGITTAATLWITAAVGMACGCGMYVLALVSTLATLIVLVAIRHFEKKFLTHHYLFSHALEICFLCSVNEYEKIEQIIKENFPNITKFKKKMQKEDVCCVHLNVVTAKDTASIQKLFKNLKSVEIKEI